MKRLSEWKLMFRFFVDHLIQLLALIVFSCIFVLIFYLYGVPIYVYGYAFLISGAAGFLMVIFSYCRYRGRHRELYYMFKRITVECGGFPSAGTLIEADYQELLDELHRFTSRKVEEEKAGRKEMEDYYTLWVHQIKTPITAMRLLLQVDHQSQNQVLLQQLVKIERYVSMVLQYLRLENMTSDLKLQEYKVLDLVRKAVKQDSSVFIYRKIGLNLEEMQDTVITDEKWMVFVIEQLLSNALKYTNKGHISIYMEQSARETLVIEDTGIGIREEDLPRVFENGFTGYNGRMEKKSTGIGLYLCKKIIDRLGHSIRVTSRAGKGTRVMIDLYREKLDTE